MVWYEDHKIKDWVCSAERTCLPAKYYLSNGLTRIYFSTRVILSRKTVGNWIRTQNILHKNTHYAHYFPLWAVHDATYVCLCTATCIMNSDGLSYQQESEGNKKFFSVSESTLHTQSCNCNLSAWSVQQQELLKNCTVFSHPLMEWEVKLIRRITSDWDDCFNILCN